MSMETRCSEKGVQMKEFMINYRGYTYLWADNEEDAEKVFKRRFRRASLNGEVEHIEASLYFDTDEKEQTWQK